MKSRKIGIIGGAAGLAAAAALSGMMRGAEPAFPTNRPRLNPPSLVGMTSKQKTKMRRASENKANQLANRRERKQRRDPIETARQRGINAMTNWQRSRWARAGYPYDVAKYETMKRRA